MWVEVTSKKKKNKKKTKKKGVRIFGQNFWSDCLSTFTCCQLEKETLSIVFACSEFQEYVYGRKFLIENDHKSLKIILTKLISEAPHPRIQCFMLNLQKYDFGIHGIPGKLIILADTLSRATIFG